MSPVSRGRKKKRGPAAGSRGGRRPASPYGPVLLDAQRLVSEPSMFVAEQWASELLGSLWDAAWTQEKAEPDEVLEARVEALAEYLLTDGSRAALAALRALAAVGEDWLREGLDEAADVLAERGVREPAWRRRSDPKLAGAYAVNDPFGEVELVALGFDRDGTQHAVLVLLAHVAGSHIAKIMAGELAAADIDAMVGEFRDDPSFSDPVALTGAQARARLEGPLVALLEDGPEEVVPVAHIFEGVEGDPVSAWALLRVRLDTLPDDLLRQEAADAGVDSQLIATAFLASTYAAGLPDRELARRWAQLAGDWAVESAGAVHRLGPVSLGLFLTAEVSPHVLIDEADLAVLPEIIRAWAHFTVDAGGLSPEVHDLWDEHLPDLLSDFAAEYADAESATHRSSCPEAYSLRPFPSHVQTKGRVRTTNPHRTKSPAKARTSAKAATGAPAPEALFDVAPGLSRAATIARSAPAETSPSTATVYQLKVLLRDTRPPVWRRLLAASTTTLGGLHAVIQAAFGWDDDHLWVFTTAGGEFGPTPDLDHRDPNAVRLSQIAGEGERFGYLFDFGDNWDHEITVERVLPIEFGTSYPVCIGGRQPDPKQYGYEYDDGFGGEVFDKMLINSRLAWLATRV